MTLPPGIVPSDSLPPASENRSLRRSPRDLKALKDSLPQDHLEETALLFASLSDPTRLRILLALRDGGELCVSDVASLLSASITMTSHHLRRMREMNLLKSRTDGRVVFYSLARRFPVRLVQKTLKRFEDDEG